MDSSKVHESQTDKSPSVRSKRTQSESTVSFKDPLPKRAKAVRSEALSPEPLESLQTSMTGILNRPLSNTSLGQLSVSDLEESSSAEALPTPLSSSPLDSKIERSHSSSTAISGANQTQYSASAEMADADTSGNPSSESTITPASPLPAAAVFANATTRKKIVDYLTCYSERSFRPFFKQGMLRVILAQPRVKVDGQPFGYGDVSDMNMCEIMADNFEFTEILTSKLFAQEYSQAFYSQNHFEFDDPRAARWFFENIGRRNFTSLNDIGFNIYGGFDLTAHNHNSLTGRSFEEIWVEVFNFLKYRHRFRQLVISVLSMPGAEQLKQDVESDKLTIEDIEDRAVYLARLPRAIENVRGLKKVHLTDWTGEVFPNRASMQRSSLLMQQVRLVYDPTKDMRNLSLSSTLARVKDATAKAHLGTTNATTQQADDNDEQEQENKFRPSKSSSVVKDRDSLPNLHGTKHQQSKQKHPRQAPRRGGSGQGGGIIGTVDRNRFYGRKKRVFGEL
ncbi:hypothetical protein DV736_g1413, partial [Chaetothyriales sp. CBS 134916]